MYFVNKGTGETSWELPTEDAPTSAAAQQVSGGVEAVGDQKIAALWEELQTEDGRTYYVNTLTQETSWEKPNAEELNAAAVSERGNLNDHDTLVVAVLSVLANMMYENDANIGRFMAADGVPTFEKAMQVRCSFLLFALFFCLLIYSFV